jgi:Tfp pilus assembly protein PilV
MLETLVATMVMLIGISGLMALFAIAAKKNVSQGSQASRCTEYAQDKMEQLMALSATDTTSNTTQVPTVATGGTGLTPNGGSVYPNAVTLQYVDYVTEGQGSGSAIYSSPQTNSAYVRQWSIVPSASDSNILTITVSVKALFTADAGQTLTTTLVSQKTKF